MRVTRAAVFYGPGNIKVENKDLFEPRKEEAQIRVKYVGICGSDVNLFFNKCAHGVHGPVILGHEFSGIVEKVHMNHDKKLAIGDLVVVETIFSCGHCTWCKKGKPNLCPSRKIFGREIDGAMAEYINVPLRNIYKVPKDVKLKEATFTEPLAVALHAVRKAEIKLGDSAAIIGSGTIGILIGQLARMAGCYPIFIIDHNSYRLSIAEKYGLYPIDTTKEDFVSVVKSETKNKGVSVIFEAAGATKSFNKFLSLAGIEGRVVIVGTFQNLALIDLYHALLHEVTIFTSRLFTPEDFSLALEIIANHRINTKWLITDIIALDEIDKGMETMLKGNALRVLIAI